jgi:hypothetical protein
MITQNITSFENIESRDKDSTKLINSHREESKNLFIKFEEKLE